MVFLEGRPTGERSRIEEFLDRAPGEERWVLLRELLRVEVEHRRGQGEVSRPEDHSARFPAEAQVIQGVFAEARAVDPGMTIRLAEMRALSPPGYEVLKELGSGGMGVVYLARNKLMDRQEVLKLVSPQFLKESGAAERFLREICAAARLSHTNIVTAYAALQRGELLVLAMEYVEGEDLARVVKAHGPLPLPNACAYACQAALGLQHAFEKGMIHRDIKPRNLILGRDGKNQVVKILDFGLAKATREKEGAARKLTEVGVMMGTPEYVAPEQIVDAARADIRADLYSLGCTLYCLLSGSPPFRGQSQFDVLQAHHTKEATPLDQLRTDVPSELAAVVAKMMAKDPARRYQKPLEVAQVLAPFAKAGLKPLPVSAPAEAGKGGVPSTWLLGKAEADEAVRGTVVAGNATPSRAKNGDTERGRPRDGKRSRKWPLVVGLGVTGLFGVLGLCAIGLFLLNREPERKGDEQPPPLVEGLGPRQPPEKNYTGKLNWSSPCSNWLRYRAGSRRKRRC